MRTGSIRVAGILCAAALSWANNSIIASAAEFQVLSGSPNIVTISGEFAEGDQKTFIRSTLNLNDAIVLFQSNGGNLAAGLEIGKAVRLMNFSTFVPDQVTCASACALAWLGGTRRYMSRTARVGFHAAYRVDGGSATESGMGNALVGAYLNSLGLPDRAVAYMTVAAPHDMQWLTPSAAQALGLNVEVLDLARTDEATPHVTAPEPEPTPEPDPPQPHPPSPPSSGNGAPQDVSNLHVCRLKDTMVLGSPSLVVNGQQRRKLARGEHLRLVEIDQSDDIRIALNPAQPLERMVRLSIFSANTPDRYYLVYWTHVYSLTRINGSVLGRQSNYLVYEVDVNEFNRLCPRKKFKTLNLAKW